MQEKETTNQPLVTEGRVLAIDPGTKRIGVAVCDELRITTRPLDFIPLSSWKKLLSKVKELISEFDAKALVIGLPLESDGTESQMSSIARDWSRKFNLSVDIPVILQDERVTTYEAKSRLWSSGRSLKETREQVDSEAAAIILEDFLRIGK